MRMRLLRVDQTNHTSAIEQRIVLDGKHEDEDGETKAKQIIDMRAYRRGPYARTITTNLIHYISFTRTE